MTAVATLLIGVALVLSGATAKPRVWISSPDPLTVRGAGFHAREHVKLTVTGNGVSRQRQLTAARTGAFTARFATPFPAKHCFALLVRAAGAAGSRATMKSPPNAIDCPPPPPEP